MKNTLPRLLAIVFSTLTVGMASAQMNLDDDAKLRELERAMQTPSEMSEQPKPNVRRTRAIVFDNQPESAAQESGSANVSSNALPKTSAAAEPMNCAALPPGVKAISVDFPIQFNVGSATVSASSERTLSQIARILALSPDRCVIVEGHTDFTGNQDRNVILSQDRANSVVNFISNKNNIDRKRLVPLGKGASDPIQNLDARDPRNRRVVFKVVTG